MEQKAIQFLNKKGEKLWGVLTVPSAKGKVPVVIMCPGFGQTKSQRKFVELGRALAKNDIASFRFDFSGQGDSQGDFAKLGIKNQVEDLIAAYETVIQNKKIDITRIVILGHSLGALIAVLFQAKYKKAKSLILLSPALHQKELVKEWYLPKQLVLWQKQGYLDTSKGRLGLRYLKEAFSRNWSEIISQVDVPVLFVHGKDDEDVPLKYTEDLFKKSGGKKKLAVVKGSDHHFEGFGAKKALNKLVLAWL